MLYYLSNTIIHFTTNQQFPINSFARFPLTILIFPVEIFSFFFGFYFLYTLFNGDYVEEKKELKNKREHAVAILLPVYNEPKDIVKRTLEHVKKIRWPGKIQIYLLDDSTNEDSKKDMRDLAGKYTTHIVTRLNRDGYKAGNINNAVKNHVKEDYFVILDSDQAPYPEFLEETMDYFSNEEVAFVQSPQHFVNDNGPLQKAAKTGTDIFYRAQAPSKSKDSAIPFCGTNLVVRASVFRKVGGFAYYTATEDIELGIRMNEQGYRGAYVPKILARGYAPADFKAYSSQQYRWANGNLAILRENFFKLFFGKFPFRYRVHMFFTVGWWLIGIVTLIYMIVPVLSLILGTGTHHTWLPSYMFGLLFLNVALGIGTISVSLDKRVKGEKIRFRDALLEYSLIVNTMFIYTRAAVNALIFKKYIGFIRTNKKAEKASLKLIKWNLILGAFLLILSLYAFFYAARSSDLFTLRSYLPISLWLLFYSTILFSSIIFVGGKNE